IAIITAKAASMPAMTGVALPFFRTSAHSKPPSIAPLVRPVRANAAFKTNGISRLAYATTTNPSAHATVERLLNFRKYSSLRSTDRYPWITSIVETDASAESAELTDDMAADRMATIKRPFMIGGTAVRIKMG